MISERSSACFMGWICTARISRNIPCRQIYDLGYLYDLDDLYDLIDVYDLDDLCDL